MGDLCMAFSMRRPLRSAGLVDSNQNWLSVLLQVWVCVLTVVIPDGGERASGRD